MGLFRKMFSGAKAEKRRADRRAAKERRLLIKVGGKTERAAIDANSAVERSAIAANAGFDPTAISSGGGKLSGFFDKAKDMLGNAFGGGSASPEISPSGEPVKDNKMMMFGLAGAALLAFFMFKKKK